jgi:2-iminobutanoate/2-iminopropanoate deaminase
MKTIISSNKAPQAVGPYSQGIKAGNMIFLAGQIALTPEGSLLEGDVQTQAHQVFANIKALLAEAGATLDNVVKATMFLDDMNDFKQANEIYGQYFTSNYPARSTVEVARLPLDVKVEIEVIAMV